MEDLIVFEAKGYPIIKVYNDYFEIKAIDYWEFRKFEFNYVKKIELYKPSENISPITLSIYSIFKKNITVYHKKIMEKEYMITLKLKKIYLFLFIYFHSFYIK